MVEYAILLALMSVVVIAMVAVVGKRTGSIFGNVSNALGGGATALTGTDQIALTASDGATNDQFGVSVSMTADGSTALVGAHRRPSGTGFGGAYIFIRPSGGWSTTSTPAATLTFSGGMASDEFGAALSLSADGGTAMIGAYTPFGTRTGAVYVFTRPTGGWITTSTPSATLTASSTGVLDKFGFPVRQSADGSTAFVGAYGRNALTGAAYVFVRPNGGWATTSVPSAMLTAGGAAVGDSFASSAALSADGNTILAGAFKGNSAIGAAYLFTRPMAGWASTSVPSATLTLSGGVANDLFGANVALSADGSTALATADGRASSTGAAYVFIRPTGGWATASVPSATITAGVGVANDLFGAAATLSADGSVALIGAYGRNSSTGAAYVFIRPVGGWATTSAPSVTLTVTAGSAGDGFGASVAMTPDGSTALIGARYWRSSTGAAYIFN